MTAPAEAGSVFTPEQLTDEHRAIRDAIGAFVATQVRPRRAEVEGRNFATHRALLERLGADGYLGIDVPEAFGGAGLDRISSLIVNEAMGTAGSFGVTYAAHTGIGTLPVVFFGTDAQKARYLPGLADGTRVGAYCLTEPSAGSDAMGIRTRATRLPDGGWQLDGAKQFITNAGFADLFTVYAKIDGTEFSAFLVERDTPGVVIGREEEKMGLHGASTCPVTLEAVALPAGALLGEAGKGHRIAFNVLNVGRFKLAATCVGGMREVLGMATAYAGERTAFGRRLADMPLIGAKLADLAARTYAVESTVYRIGGLLEASLATADDAIGADGIRTALEEYAVECSIAKVLGSEELGVAVDELVQVYGGYGYIEEYPAAGLYRDARIQRIWEGTSEINRLLIPGTLLKRAMTGRLDLLGPATRAQDALLGGDLPSFDGPFAREDAAVANARTATLLLAGAAVQRHGTALEHEQELLAGLADLAIDLFAMESSLERAKLAAGHPSADVHAELARLVVADRAATVEGRAKMLGAALASGDEARTLVAGLRRILRGEPTDRIDLGRRVAASVITRGGYPA
jgi:alkylation response protein AidB-like acyl-CoA dehydrogenase